LIGFYRERRVLNKYVRTPNSVTVDDVDVDEDVNNMYSVSYHMVYATEEFESRFFSVLHFKDAIIMLLPTAISKYLSYCHGHSDSSGKTEPTIFSIPASGEFTLSGSDETKSARVDRHLRQEQRFL
jgi:hypothetical protein